MKLTIILTLLFSLNLLNAQDHSDYIEGPFTTPQEVTETCLECHENAGEEIIQSRHWNWLGKNISGDSTSQMVIGKQNLVNNFCIAVPSNWPRCTSCHIGYGWKDDSFDHGDASNIDCLICHDQSGLYKKIPTGAGLPFEEVDLVKSAQSVGLTTRKNCGTCHFDGGGGTGVKHGDMDNSLYEPSEELDVHMGGLDFQCEECHVTENHKISGASHGSMSTGSNHISCLNCHDDEVHEKASLNKHINAVACETCHIPTFARQEPTKVWWDWSKAGEDRDIEKDKFGHETYSKKKGEFIWDMDVIPTYKWYNGHAEYYSIGEKVDPENILKLNKIQGAITDSNAKIYPFKVMRGKQPFDSENNYIIIPKLYGEGGYWKTFDWNLAAINGMPSVNLDYSGNIGFIETEMSWPINHSVAPAKDALKCTNCHGKKGTKRLNWKALGYAGDPMKTGGRRNTQ